MTLSYINSRTINHFVIYSYTVLYGFNQLLTNPLARFREAVARHFPEGEARKAHLDKAELLECGDPLLPAQFYPEADPSHFIQANRQ